MKREEVLDYLRYRLKLADDRKYNQFDQQDVIFIRNYVYHKTGKTVPMEQVGASMTKYPLEIFMQKIDYMINQLIAEFKIKIEWTQIVPAVRNLYGTEVYDHKVKAYE